MNQKNDWLKIIDNIYIKTLEELKKRNDDQIVIATNYFQDRIFYDLLKFKDKNFNIVSKNELTYFNDISNYICNNFLFPSNRKKYLFCSAMSRNRFEIIRDFDKATYNKVDFFPFISLFDSDIENILNICSNENIKNINESFKKIKHNKYYYINEKFTAEELEWAQIQDLRNNIISSKTSDPTKHYSWHSYSAQQQQLIARLWAIEKETAWKIQPPTMLQLEINR